MTESLARDIPLSHRPVQGTLHLLLADSALPPAALPESFTVSEPRVPPAYDWCRGFTQVLVEVLAGYRLPTQLARHTTPAIFSEIRKRAMPPPRPGARITRRRPRVHQLHLCAPTTQCAEVSVVVAEGQRLWALALRIELQQHRWVVTAWESG